MRYGRGLTAKADGTRVRLFAQPSFLPRYRVPETVLISPPAGSLGPGPSDSRMYVVHPVGKPRPYGLVAAPGAPPLLYLPPWDGPILSPAVPSPDGHLDHLPAASPEFELAHVYGTARFVLDVWEGYLERPLPWHFERDQERLEISLLRGFDNSRAGYGFLEIGADVRPDGSVRPFGLNFEVVAHELGHLIIYSLVGLPDPVDETGDYYGFHESAADLVALLAAANLATVVDELFDQTRGNLYVPNELNRFAELTEQEQIRVASNPLRPAFLRPRLGRRARPLAAAHRRPVRPPGRPLPREPARPRPARPRGRGSGRPPRVRARGRDPDPGPVRPRLPQERRGVPRRLRRRPRPPGRPTSPAAGAACAATPSPTPA
jgi:hypothetical protein